MSEKDEAARARHAEYLAQYRQALRAFNLEELLWDWPLVTNPVVRDVLFDEIARRGYHPDDLKQSPAWSKRRPREVGRKFRR